MKKSAAVRLTLLTAVAMGAHAQQRLDPCAAATFNEQACRMAIQSRGYCWNGRWVRMKYSQPFPYYYDAYQEFLAKGGVVSEAVVGSCGGFASSGFFIGRHGGFVHGGFVHGGFGATSSHHGAHS